MAKEDLVVTVKVKQKFIKECLECISELRKEHDLPTLTWKQYLSDQKLKEFVEKSIQDFIVNEVECADSWDVINNCEGYAFVEKHFKREINEMERNREKDAKEKVKSLETLLVSPKDAERAYKILAAAGITTFDEDGKSDELDE